MSSENGICDTGAGAGCWGDAGEEPRGVPIDTVLPRGLLLPALRGALVSRRVLLGSPVTDGGIPRCLELLRGAVGSLLLLSARWVGILAVYTR